MASPIFILIAQWHHSVFPDSEPYIIATAHDRDILHEYKNKLEWAIRDYTEAVQYHSIKMAEFIEDLQKTIKPLNREELNTLIWEWLKKNKNPPFPMEYAHLEELFDSDAPATLRITSSIPLERK